MSWDELTLSSSCPAVAIEGGGERGEGMGRKLLVDRMG